MKGDFTHDTFDQQNHCYRVLMQQGRVLLDADWNEQASILLHYLRILAEGSDRAVRGTWNRRGLLVQRDREKLMRVARA